MGKGLEFSINFNLDLVLASNYWATESCFYLHIYLHPEKVYALNFLHIASLLWYQYITLKPNFYVDGGRSYVAICAKWLPSSHGCRDRPGPTYTWSSVKTSRRRDNSIIRSDEIIQVDWSPHHEKWRTVCVATHIHINERNSRSFPEDPWPAMPQVNLSWEEAECGCTMNSRTTCSEPTRTLHPKICPHFLWPILCLSCINAVTVTVTGWASVWYDRHDRSGGSLRTRQGLVQLFALLYFVCRVSHHLLSSMPF